MSVYGKQWRIDGVTAGPIIRHSPTGGHYSVLFEREYATIEEIEGIDWAKPVIQSIGRARKPCLPEGYGFELVKIEYDSATRTYSAEVRVGSQYLGDVAGYQEHLAELDSKIAAQAAQLAELEAAYDDN